ncbi:MAG: GNAT family N-acetyltransferase [Thermodesulfobacteriota bacterium]
MPSRPAGSHDEGRRQRWSPGERVECFQALTDIPDLGFLIIDGEYRVEFANVGTGRITGFDPRRMVGMDFLALFEPSGRAGILRALSREEGGSLDAAVSTADGVRKVVDMSWRRHEISGEGLRFVVTLKDVSGYASAQRAAKEAQEEARNLAEMADIGILVLDQEFRVEFANQMAAQLVGLTTSELHGKDFSSFLDRETRVQLKGAASGLGPGEHRRLNMEIPIQTPHREGLLAEMTLAVVGGPEGRVKAYAYLRNLTESIQLRKANEFLQNVIRSSVDGIIAADMKGNIIIFNEGAERLLGYRAHEVISKVHITQLYPPGMAKKIMRRLRSDSYGPKGKLPTTHVTLVGKSGDQVPVHISAAIVYEGQREIATVGIFTDLRERIRMQRQLEDTYKQLLHSEKLASLGKLAAGVAHEINNPLGGILIYANLLLEQEREEATKKDLQEIIEQTLRCKEIVQGLLNFARKTGEEKVPTQLNEALEKCVSLMEKQALFHNIKVEREFQADLPPILADPSQINQVFTNLIVNAAQAMDGKGRLLLRTWSEGTPTEVHVEVSDTGVGIPEQHLPRIFDPFFSTKAVGKGTGLGLSIAYGIVKRHGGEFQVRSRVGQGTTFHVKFPLEGKMEEGFARRGEAAEIRDNDRRVYDVTLAGEKGLLKLLSFYEEFEPKGAFEGIPPSHRRERRRWVTGLVAGWRNFLILAGDRVVGHVAVTMGGSVLQELIIFLHQDHRGRGLGTAALRYIIAQLEEEGCRRLWLTVENTNLPAIRCFLKVGFQFTSSLMESELEMTMDIERPS